MKDIEREDELYGNRYKFKTYFINENPVKLIVRITKNDQPYFDSHIITPEIEYLSPEVYMDIFMDGFVSGFMRVKQHYDAPVV